MSLQTPLVSMMQKAKDVCKEVLAMFLPKITPPFLRYVSGCAICEAEVVRFMHC